MFPFFFWRLYLTICHSIFIEYFKNKNSLFHMHTKNIRFLRFVVSNFNKWSLSIHSKECFCVYQDNLSWAIVCIFSDSERIFHPVSSVGCPPPLGQQPLQRLACLLWSQSRWEKEARAFATCNLHHQAQQSQVITKNKSNNNSNNTKRNGSFLRGKTHSAISNNYINNSKNKHKIKSLSTSISNPFYLVKDSFSWLHKSYHIGLFSRPIGYFSFEIFECIFRVTGFNYFKFLNIANYAF